MTDKVASIARVLHDVLTDPGGAQIDSATFTVDGAHFEYHRIHYDEVTPPKPGWLAERAAADQDRYRSPR